MSSTMSTMPTIAFFGATGGVTNAALALALKNGYKCSALARTPKKLLEMLQREHQVSSKTLEASLTIIQGSADNLSALKETLAPRNVPARLIVSGLGAAPKMTHNLLRPIAMDQPTVCGDASAAIVTALRELQRERIISKSQRPTICIISTTGIANTRDVPLSMYGLYHVVLKEAHADKKVQERNYVTAAKEAGSDAPLDSFTIVRPTLLFDGPPKGLAAVRSGWVPHDLAPEMATGEATAPAMGMRIRRNDVGLWVFENFIRHSAEWKGRCVSLTY